MSHAVRARRPWERLTEALVMPNPSFALLDGGRIVVASEDTQLRRTLASELAADGHTIVEARTCLELLHHAGVTGPSLRLATRPDAVVLDLSGERWCNASVLDAVTGGDWALPLVALCRPDDTAARAEAGRVGVRAILSLPVDTAQLRAELMSIVQPGPPLRGVA